MVIKRSAGHEIQALVADLDADDEVRREAAVARLAVIGTRAVERLVAMVTAATASPRAIASALRALESAGDVRALAPALSLLESADAEIATAAVGVVKSFLHSKHGTAALDAVVRLALDVGRPADARLAALDVLGEMGSRIVAPVWERLRDDPSLAVRQHAARQTGGVDPLAELEGAAAGVMPKSGGALSALVDLAGSDAPLATLHRLIQVVREQMTRERSQSDKTAWMEALGAIHLALASRGSRVALYDLRDTLAAAEGPLPASYVASIAAIGDPASLDAIAATYSRVMNGGATEWLESLRDAFRTIAERERAGSRSAVMKRIETKWPEAAAQLVEKKERGKRSKR